MFGTENLSFFLLTAISLNLLPSTDTLYIIARSISQGKKAGIVSVLGISTGTLLHITAAAFGLSDILVTSAIAFAVLKWIGVLYLMYLGIQMFLSNNFPKNIDIAIKNKNLWNIYQQSVLINLLNPKVALFFLGFLPRFVDTSSEHKVFSLLFLGCLFITAGMLWFMLVALLSAKAFKIVSSKITLINIAYQVTGIIFISLGIKLATE